MQTETANKTPILSATQSNKSKALPCIKNFCINSVVRPQTERASAILMMNEHLVLIVSLLVQTGVINKKVNTANNPACTHLSKNIVDIQLSAFGKSSPGRQINVNTKKNQAMPGINFLKEIFI